MLYLFFVFCSLFFLKDTTTTEIYTYGHTLSLHDALPICKWRRAIVPVVPPPRGRSSRLQGGRSFDAANSPPHGSLRPCHNPPLPRRCAEAHVPVRRSGQRFSRPRHPAASV